MLKGKPLGEILKELGRLSEADIRRTLEHQKNNGGLFGEALIALNLLDPQELEWSLATQFDLPYIFPESSAIDSSVAGLVSMEWALRHTALPIMRDGDRLTLVVDSPLQINAPAELAGMTGCEVDLALATSSSIRRVIREVFWGRQCQRMSLANASPIPMAQFLGQIRRSGRSEWGISERPERIIGWYLEGGEPCRLRLTPDWRDELNQWLDPSPGEFLEQRGQHAWPARWRDGRGGLELVAIVSEGACELSAQSKACQAPSSERFPSPEVLVELRQSLSDGVMVVGVEQPADEHAASILASIPEQILPSGHRSMFLAEHADHGPVGLPVMSVDSLQESSKLLKQFAFDVLILESCMENSRILALAMSLAPLLIVGLIAGSAVPDEVDAILSHQPGDSEDGHWSLRLRREPSQNPRA